MSYLIWACGSAWVLALVLQCVRLAFKHRPGGDRAYRGLTVAVFAAALLGVALQTAMGIMTGDPAHWRAAALGAVILALLALVS